MKTLIYNEFVQISYSKSSGALQLEWLPRCKYMSASELECQIDKLTVIVDTFKVKIIFIDAYDFNYSLLEVIIVKINSLLAKCSASIIGLVVNRTYFNEISVDPQLTKLISNKFNIVFETREDGKQWFMNLKVLVRTMAVSACAQVR